MPRPNRRRRDERPLALGGPAAVATQEYAGGRWAVRHLSGASSTRAYLCPGCSHEVAAGVPHVVVWPVDGVGGVDQRRHWHSGCWSARDRRHPTGALR
ncbi:MAG TPA: hypothetical protein VES95_07300 [Dermatophilaceae bacterium]|nr:hypothetical protein [Dermatophilaceae bacterium]